MEHTLDFTRHPELVWTIPNSQGDIEIFIPRGTKVVLNLSGGIDSAMLLYALAKYKNERNPDITFTLCTSVNLKKAFQAIYAKKIIEVINSVYPDNYEHYTNLNRGVGDLYALDIEKLNHQHSLGPNTMSFFGVSQNPPMDEMIKHDMITPERREERDAGHPDHEKVGYSELVPGCGVYRFNAPFCFHDKKGIREFGLSVGIPENLFENTRSCEDLTVTPATDKHCGTCWFCKEREWGWGTLDTLDGIE